MKKTKYINIFFLIIVIFFLGINFVYASTSAELHFCEYAGTLRTMKIIGYMILIVKILVPILLIAFAIIDLFKVVLSGKSEDITKSASTILKRVVAGFVVYLIPTALNYVFNTLISNDESNFQACTVCLFDTKDCKIPTTDPNVLEK